MNMEIEKKKKTIYKIDQYKLKEVLSDKTLSSGAKLVLHNLLFRLGGKNYVFPSQKTIGHDIGISARQVRNHLCELKRRKIIFSKRTSFNYKTKKAASSNTYYLTSILYKKEIDK